MDDPVAVPDLGVDLIGEKLLGEGGFDVLAEGIGKCLDRKEVVGLFQSHPLPGVRGKAAGGDEVVDMRVIIEATGAGVKDADEAEQAAQEPLLPAALQESVGGAAEEQVVEELLIAACKLVQLAGNGESDQEIGTGEQQMLLALQPLGSIGVSALGAVPVVTAMVTVMGAVAGRAVVNAAAQQRRAAR